MVRGAELGASRSRETEATKSNVSSVAAARLLKCRDRGPGGDVAAVSSNIARRNAPARRFETEFATSAPRAGRRKAGGYRGVLALVGAFVISWCPSFQLVWRCVLCRSRTTAYPLNAVTN